MPVTFLIRITHFHVPSLSGLNIKYRNCKFFHFCVAVLLSYPKGKTQLERVL